MKYFGKQQQIRLYLLLLLLPVTVVICLAGWSAKSFAIEDSLEPLWFSPPDEHYRDQKILQSIRRLWSIKTGKAGNVELAKVDLDGDEIGEYIARFSCNISRFCHYAVFTFKKRKVVFMGDFNARQIFISDNKTDEVRNIITYGDQNNDFRYNAYIWDSEASVYVKKDVK